MPKKPIGDFASVGEAKAYCQSLLQRGCEPLTPLTDERASPSVLALLTACWTSSIGGRSSPFSHATNFLASLRYVAWVNLVHGLNERAPAYCSRASSTSICADLLILLAIELALALYMAYYNFLNSVRPAAAEAPGCARRAH